MSTSKGDRKEPGIYALSQGRWRVRAVLLRGGTQRQAERTVEGSLADARAARDQLRAALEEAAHEEASKAKPPTARASLLAYAERWLARKEARLKASTGDRYQAVLGSQVLPRLGHLAVEEINRGHVEEWVIAVEALRKPDGLQGWWRVLVEVLRDAAAELHLPDPTARVKGPSVRTAPRRERRSLTRDELRAFVDWVDTAQVAWGDEIFTMAYTGMRGGELYALTWAQVDFDRECIHIDRAHWRNEVDTTKTGVGRVVPMTAEMATRLKARRTRMVAQQAPGLDEGLVFPAVNGKRRLPVATHKIMREGSRALGLPLVVTPQVLRRTMNNLMRQAGVDRIAMRDVMGHTTEAMTARYAHAAMDEKRRAVALVRSQGASADQEPDRAEEV